jgi:hypothetical protein
MDQADDGTKWPNADHSEEISRMIAIEGFPGCVGFIDGTTLPLAQKPALDGEVYFDRKKGKKDILFILLQYPSVLD